MLLLGLMAFCAGYKHGNDAARLEAREQLAALETARAEANAQAEREARARIEEAAARADRLQGELVRKNQELEKERKNVNHRLKKVAEEARRDCAGLSPDWVRLYNKALGFGERAGGDSPATGESPDPAGQAGTAGPGLRTDALATPEDILAHARDYGNYCQNMAAAYEALIEYEENHGN